MPHSPNFLRRFTFYHNILFCIYLSIFSVLFFRSETFVLRCNTRPAFRSNAICCAALPSPQNSITAAIGAKIERVVLRWKEFSFHTLNCKSISGISSYVLPFNSLPFFFLFFPPHCLKKNATSFFSHCS